MDKVGPRNLIHSLATDTDDPTVEPRWGKVGKQTITDEGPLPPHPMDGIKYNMETFDEVIRDTRQRLHRQGGERRQAVLRLDEPDAHARLHPPLARSTRRCATRRTAGASKKPAWRRSTTCIGAVMQKLEGPGRRRQHHRRLHHRQRRRELHLAGRRADAVRRRQGHRARGRLPRARRSCAGRARCRPGKVENGIISGLDWFPTLVAAAGDPNIVERAARRARRSAARTTRSTSTATTRSTLLTGKGPSKRHEIFYFAESDARRGAARRLQVPLHRPAGRLARRHGQGRLADASSTCGSIRSSARGHAERRRLGWLCHQDFYVHEFWRFVFVQQEVGQGRARPSSTSRRCRRARASTWRR